MKLPDTIKIIALLGMMASINFSQAIANNGTKKFSPVQYREISSFCDDRMLMLEQIKTDALDAWGMGNAVHAVQLFHSGLVSVDNMAQSGQYGYSLTSKAISRLLVTAHALGISNMITGQHSTSSSMLPIQSSRELQFMVRYMSSSYEFILSTSNHLDRSMYIPYYYKLYCPGCNGVPVRVNIQDMEKDMIQYIISEFELFKNHFVSMRESDGAFTPMPSVGFALKALKIHAEIGASEIGENIFGRIFECNAKRLIILANRIEAYLNSTNVDQDPSALIFFNRSIIQFEKILNSIKAQQCSI